MQKALFLVILVGVAIGALMPVRTPAPPSSPATEASAPDEEEAEESFYGETLIERDESGHFYVDAEVNGEAVHFVVDTGASGVALTMDDAERIGIDFSPNRFGVIGSGASGPVRGQLVTLDTVSVDGKEVEQVPGAVLEGLEISLLGQSYLSQIGSVSMRGDVMRLE